MPDKRDECGCHKGCTSLPHTCTQPCCWPACLTPAEESRLVDEILWDELGGPVIGLDVDGPLNPFDAKPSRRPEGYTTHRLRPAGFENARKPLRVWLRPDHGPMLLRFARRIGGQLVWITTWEHDANRMIGPRIGLPELPVIEFGGHPHTLPGWKYPPVLKYAAGRPLLWFDDDFRAVSPNRVRAVMDFMAARDAPTLLHDVSPKIGLTETDLDAAAEWWAAQ